VIDQSCWSHLLLRRFLWLLQRFFWHLHHHHCGDGLLSTNVDNTFNLYDGCTRC
jgi:hypothetical protein